MGANRSSPKRLSAEHESLVTPPSDKRQTNDNLFFTLPSLICSKRYRVSALPAISRTLDVGKRLALSPAAVAGWRFGRSEPLHVADGAKPRRGNR